MSASNPKKDLQPPIAHRSLDYAAYLPNINATAGLKRRTDDHTVVQRKTESLRNIQPAFVGIDNQSLGLTYGRCRPQRIAYFGIAYPKFSRYNRGEFTKPVAESLTAKLLSHLTVFIKDPSGTGFVTPFLTFLRFPNSGISFNRRKTLRTRQHAPSSYQQLFI